VLVEDGKTQADRNKRGLEQARLTHRRYRDLLYRRKESQSTCVSEVRCKRWNSVGWERYEIDCGGNHERHEEGGRR
jgi:hypothetical protein